jgi:hypothetical protein
MKSALLCLVLLVSFACLADDGEIQELDNGACWAQQTGEGSWRVASFNDHAVFEVNQEFLENSLEPALTKELLRLKAEELPRLSYSVHLYCSGAGHLLKINFKDAKVPLCVHTDAELKDIKVFINPERQEGACNGAGLEKLVVKALDASHAQMLVDILTGTQYGGMIKDADLMPRLGSVVLHLQPEWRFRESQARALLEQDPNVQPHVEQISYAYVWNVVGQSLQLMTRTPPTRGQAP